MNKIKELLIARKKTAILGLTFIILVGGIFAARAYMQRGANLTENIPTEILARAPLSVYVSATGTIDSNQSAVLNWSTSGEIETVVPLLGQSVTAGDLLASLAKNSLSPHIILAQAELVGAQKALDDLLQSSTQQAGALKDVENAQQALEDARDPSKLQADAQLALAESAQALESVQRRFDILTTTPSELAISQSYANKILAEQALVDINEQIERYERKVRQAAMPFMQEIYQNILEGLQFQRHSKIARYNDAVEKYFNLTSPPNPLDLTVAQADLATAQAQYSTALRTWDRIENGLSAAEFAVLEAVLTDAHREWERVKNGPTPEDIASARVRMTAAQAVLDQSRLTAPFDGVITHISAQPGDQVDIGLQAFRIDDLSALLVTMQVSEMEISQVAIDQSVLLTLDAVFAQIYHGQVVEISPVGTEQLGVVYFEVVVSISDADQAVRPGMTVDVELLVHQVVDTLLVPNQAVRWLDGEQVVYVIGNNPPADYFASNSQAWPIIGLGGKSIYPVMITLGLKSDSYSEVIAGNITAGDEILLGLPDEYFEN
jgi:HlyD family secretion protein